MNTHRVFQFVNNPGKRGHRITEESVEVYKRTMKMQDYTLEYFNIET